MNIYIYIIFITILFTIYVEYSAGGILFRPDSTGKNIFNIKSLLSYLIHPLHSKFLWNPSLLDINYIFVLGISLLLYHILISHV